MLRELHIVFLTSAIAVAPLYSKAIDKSNVDFSGVVSISLSDLVKPSACLAPHRRERVEPVQMQLLHRCLECSPLQRDLASKLEAFTDTQSLLAESRIDC